MQARRPWGRQIAPWRRGRLHRSGIGGAFASAPSAPSAVTETCPTSGGPTKSGRAFSSQKPPAGRGRGCPDQGSYSLTPPTVLTVFSLVARIRMTLFPARPSRLNVISMPNARKNVCARRRRPARARGFLDQPVLSRAAPSLPPLPPTRRRSAALPVHELGPLVSGTFGRAYEANRRAGAMICPRAATESASTMPVSHAVAECGISHPWHTIQAKLCVTQIKKGAEDAGTREFELPPQFPLGLPPCVAGTVLAEPCSPDIANNG